MVGNGDAMRVARQIMQHVLRATEGRLGIHHPVLLIKSTQEEGEMLLFMKRHALAGEAQLMADKEALQSGDELAAEDAAEHLDRQQEAGRRSDPARVVLCESAPRCAGWTRSQAVHRDASDRQQPRAVWPHWLRTARKTAAACSATSAAQA